MSVRGEGVRFHPLCWMYNDQWEWYERPERGPDAVNHHYGHCHVFMPRFPFDSVSSDAFSGKMKYTFTQKDIWGGRSEDPNQAGQFDVIGTPKWYFTIEEVWRRVYIQPWDVTGDSVDIAARRGVRWDASAPFNACGPTHGPYREGKDSSNGMSFFPLWLAHGRTCPIDYFTNSSMSQVDRTNVVHDLAQTQLMELANFYAGFPNETRTSQEIYDEDLYVEQQWTFDEHEGFNYYIPGGGFQTIEHPAAKPGWSDSLYIWPLLEYQTVVPLREMSLPSASTLDFENPYDVTEDFGDGWQVQVDLPLEDPETGEYRSPFGPSAGQVFPIGNYFNNDFEGNPLVEEEKKARYGEIGEYCRRPHEPDFRPTDICTNGNFYDPPFDPSEELSGQLLEWHNPYGEQADGRWVQQFLGARVVATNKVCLEHKFGGRSFRTTTTTQYIPTTAFSGTE